MSKQMWIQIQQPSYFGAPWKFTGEIVIVLFASNMMVPLTVGSFLLTLYSIFPVVGSKITHLSFHFLSVSDRLRRGPCNRFLPEPDANCRLILSKLVWVSPSIRVAPFVAIDEDADQI